MKIKLLAANLLFIAANAHAATGASYTASADPASNPDANGNTVNAWTVVGDGGSGDSFLYTDPSSSATDWAITETPSSTTETTATDVFSGGALDVGQSVSIDYAHGAAIDGGHRVGINLLDASGDIEASFSFLGGDSDGFEYYDTGSGTYAATGKTYDANDPFTITYTIGPADTYVATASLGSNGGGSTGAWSGSFTAPIDQIQVFTDSGYNSDESVQLFNNLTVTDAPEPSTFILAGLGGAILLGLRKRKLFQS